ncbi:MULTISPECIES: pyroglutamyl-peptidase I [Sulfitobacter]|uniref:pyroglutamyl-peptidase I n=1 Tax=Sulfitobacter TaxID=60136 RepID=UPI000EEAB9EA|nr:pyroglutamyl-peptidase I [Sulfitobacter indolifex]HCQ58636.1 hypothetical protein [Sulfitobacter sp.]
MNEQKTVIVAGYGAWAKADNNPASETAKRVAGLDWGHHRVVHLEVPVRTQGLMSFLTDAIGKYAPDHWLGFGIAPGACGIRLEALGTNWRSFDVPDNDGLTLAHEATVSGGPAAYDATVPNGRIVTACRDQGIPAAISYSAGNHLCNQMLYTTLHLVETGVAQMNCGFMHLPMTPEMVAAEDAEKEMRPSMALEMMARAGGVAVKTLLEEPNGD